MTYIICEIGSNWTTEEDMCLSITRAAIAGADAVKFQIFNEMDLYGPGVGFKRECEPNIELAAQRAKDCGIDLLCSAFSPAAVKYVDPFVRMHKIASAEMCHVDLIDAVVRTGKPILLSTGGHTIEEIHRALDYLGPAVNRTTLMYCESAYPANNYMPEKLGFLTRDTGLPVGISDHSTEIYLTAWMCDYYASPVIEKHVNLVGAVGPDAGHSLDADEFKLFCDYIKNRNCIVSDVISGNEADMVTQHNRRLVATCFVPKGSVFAKGINFGIYRGQTECAQALSPFDWEKVNGRVAAMDIKANTAICEGDYL